ncbi:M23 family metallopeptidase [Nocardia sp. AG03]|uniref:M23 family metallopeptidase n=1 Tax=Nocardia sp. AG03 TaxID=3025312 RepID=UPI00241873B0|nr:M23 family metallopeptidase [Nocardia sp. AG03]
MRSLLRAGRRGAEDPSPRADIAEDEPTVSADLSTSDDAARPSSESRRTSRPALVNGRLLPANWRTEQPAKAGVTERFSTWAARYPVTGELRRGEVGKVFWQRPKARVEALWAQRPTPDRLRHVLIERRVLIAGMAAVALFAAADGHLGDALTQYPPSPGEAQRVAIAYPPQVPPNPQSAARMLAAIAKGEKRREAGVVAAATLATLERAKAEAAAAASGEWQPWMGERAPVVPGVLVPGSTPSTGGFSLPAKGAFTSGFGSRWGTMHRGIDIAAPIGSPIYAVADGTVIEAGPAQGFGLWVRIKHDDGTISIYGHMYDFIVSPGERVPAGMQIARIGNRGDSTGPHLHFEIVQNGQHVDPQAWLALHGLSLT